jgi:hypothetical protein
LRFRRDKPHLGAPISEPAIPAWRPEMKKTDEKRFTLKKITIAHLGSEQLGKVAGGLPRFTGHSICAEQCCETDPNANCPRTF